MQLDLPENPPGWAGTYVGIPWVENGRARTGCDCWGLVRLVLQQRATVEVPAYGDVYRCTAAQHVDACAAAVKAVATSSPWVTIAERDPQTQRCDLSKLQQLDLVVLRVWGRPMHIGVAIARDWMLHSQLGCDSILERFTDRLWINRIEGVYRHGSLA